MMQTLRKYMKHILWVVAVAFVLTIIFSWGMGGFKNRGRHTQSGIVGIINGQKIQYQQFVNIYQQELDRVKEQSNNQELNEYRVNRIRDDVWNTLVQDILMSQEIRRLNIQVTPDEVVFHMRNNPPDFIKNHEQFQTDGTFDMNKYHQALSDPRNYNAWIPVENYFRGMLPIQKLQQRVLSTIRISDGEALEFYKLDHEKVKVQYLFFDPNQITLADNAITDEMVKEYYKAHEQDYLQPETRTIKYVKFELKPSKEDTLQTYETAKFLIDELKSGADFEELAKDYSKDPGSAEKGGDLGFIRKGTMVKPFEEAVFSAKIGSIVGPVSTQFGLHVIEVLARKREKGEIQIHARHILLKHEISSETYDDISDKAQSLYNTATENKKTTFESICKENGYTLEETPPFRETGFISGIGMSNRISRLTFQNQIGWIGEPVRTGDNLVVFQISDIQKSGFKPIDEVQSGISRILEKDMRMERASKQSQEIWRKIKDSNDFTKVAQENNLEIEETDYFKMEANVSKIGLDPQFSGTAFKLKKDEISEPVEGNRGYYIIKAIDHTKTDEAAFQSTKTSLKQKLLQQKQQQVYTAWINQLKENAKIEDYRDEYFY